MATKTDIQLDLRTGLSDGRRIYPWETWADGATWLLKLGVDYHCTTSSMRTGAKLWARRHGYRVATRIADGGFYLRFVKETGEAQ